MTDVAILHLPFPPSSNAVTRAGRGKDGKTRFYSSKAKTDFFAAADKLCLLIKPTATIMGRFTYHLILNRAYRRGNADGDNRGKYVLDYAQRIGFIGNDKFAEGGSWQWGECEFGAMLSVFPFPRNINES